MDLTSLYFLAFVFIACLLYYLVPKKVQWVILLVSSVAFFIVSSGILTVYMIAATVAIYFCALWISQQTDAFELQKENLDKSECKEAKKQLKKRQKACLVITIIAVLGILAVLKYCNLGIELANIINRVFHTSKYFEKFSIILPLGISYYSLMAVSYVTDVYRGIIKAEKNPLRVLLFVCYFPHIVEGPFDRYKDLDSQFRTVHRFEYNSFCKGLILIIFGFYKKLVIADRLGITVSEVFNNSDNYSGPAIVIVTVMYTIQLYCDFSGCIDIVAGVSELFGIKIAENFRQPFFSKSISEFWRRWHISLGLWLKEYVYYPVILSKHFSAVNNFIKKHSKSKHLIDVIPAAYALFFVWFTNGLWHGASIKFILYGLYYYFIMMIGEFCKPLFIKAKNKLHISDNNKPFSAFQVLRTFFIVNIGMLLFRSTTVKEFVLLIKKSVTSFNYLTGVKEVLGFRKQIIYALIGVVILFVVSTIFEKNKQTHIGVFVFNKPMIIRDIIIIISLLIIIFCGVYGPGYSASEFIYAGF